MQKEFLRCPASSASDFVLHMSRDQNHVTVDFGVSQWGRGGNGDGGWGEGGAGWCWVPRCGCTQVVVLGVWPVRWVAPGVVFGGGRRHRCRCRCRRVSATTTTTSSSSSPSLTCRRGRGGFLY